MNKFNQLACLVAILAAGLPTVTGTAFQKNQTGQTAADGNQKWQGVLDVKVAQLTLNFDLTQDADGTWSGNIYSADQGNARIPVSKMDVSGNRVTIETTQPPAKFAGTISDDQKTITGKWTQGPGRHDLVLRRVESFDEGTHVETWQGTLEAAGQKFDFGLRVFQKDDGTWLARLDSYNEGATGLRATLNRDDSRFDFSISSIAAEYSGTLDQDAGKVTGFWKQGGGKFPLDFQKVDLQAGPRRLRPQIPEKPFPYQEVPVKFENDADHVTLAGTLTLPEGAGPWPAMVLITGSGPQDRDETIFDHKPFLVIADHLTRNGIAVLRYDDRGTAESTGNFATATSQDFSRDAEAAVTWLKSRPEIDAKKIGLIGHSEGGLIAPLIAARCPDVALIVLLAGTGVDGAEITLSQTRAMAEISGTQSDIVDASEYLISQVLTRIAESDEPLPPEFVDSVFTEAVSKLENPQWAPALETTRTGLAAMDSPWYRFFARFDPQTILRQVRCPVLALNGTKDLQVLADLNIDAIAKALTEGGNPDFEVHKMENLNHLFQETDGNGSVLEYARIEQTISPQVLDLMTDWILERTR